MTKIDFETFRTSFPIFHIDVSHQLYENTQFPNIVITLKFREIPAHDYLVWVLIYNHIEATLNLKKNISEREADRIGGKSI